MKVFTTTGGTPPIYGVSDTPGNRVFADPIESGWFYSIKLGSNVRRLTSFLLFFFLFSFLNREAIAQCVGPNLLTNPSFESPVVTNLNGAANVMGSIPGWQNYSDGAGLGLNIVRPNGSAGADAPDNAADGSQYLDLFGATSMMQQSFTLTAPAMLAFSGSFSNRGAGVYPAYAPGEAGVQIINAQNQVVATNSIFTTASIGNKVWLTNSGLTSLLPAGTYRFEFFSRTDYMNYDNMSVCVVSNAATACASRSVLKPQPGWSATASGSIVGWTPDKAIDGSVAEGNGWHTAGASGVGSYITFDYGTPKNLVGFVYYPRIATSQDINGYTIQTSNDGVTFTTLQTGTMGKQSPSNVPPYNVGNPLEVNFTTGVTARYMRLVINSLHSGGNGAASIMELLPIVCETPTLPTISCTNANLLNTGTNISGTGLGIYDQLDANWEVAWVPNNTAATYATVSNATFTPAVVGNKVPTGWAFSPFGNAEWISYSILAGDPTAIGVPNDYFFRYRFTISDPYLLSVFKLKLNFLADNEVENVYINGVGQAPQLNLPQANGNYSYSGFFLANQATTTLSNNWQLGTNEIVVHVKSFPGFNGFMGQNIVSCPGLDYGDAPASYNVSRTTSGAGHIIETNANGIVTLKLGNLVDAEADGVASVSATSDNTTGQNDEDGVSLFPTIQGTNNLSLTNYTVTVALNNSTGATANLCGWIDWNNNGTFDAGESICVTVPNGATSAQLIWPSVTLTGVTGGTTDTYARFRITTDALASNSANGAASNGEVEDYFIPFCIIPAPTATLATPATICSGAPVTINFTTNPAGQTVQWIRQPGGVTGVGTINDAPTALGTVPVSYTYSSWISSSAGGCSSETVTTGVTVNPVPVITPSVCSQTICSGETGAITFTSSVSATINWLRVEDGATGTGDISQLFNSAGTNTYKIWGVSAAPASCPSSTTITCVIVVHACTVPCNLTVTASASQTAVCMGQPIALASTVSGNAGTVVYAWTGPNGFTSNLANPSIPSASSLTAGTYTIYVSDPTSSTSCVRTASVQISVGSLFVFASSNSPLCSTGTLSLTGTATGGNGSYTYNWSGPNGFVSAGQNPTLALSTTAQSGTYSVVVTDSQGCSGTGTTGVVVAAQPNLSVTGAPSLTLCSGASTTLNVAGDGGAPVSWTSSAGQSGTGTTITFANFRNLSSLPQSVTFVIVASAGSCSDQEIVVLTINPEPVLQVTPSAAVYCNIEEVKITATATPATTINWTRTPATPTPATGSGASPLLVQETLPVGNYSYQFTATGVNGCTSQIASVPVTVQQ